MADFYASKFPELRANAFFEVLDEETMAEIAPCFHLEEVTHAGERIIDEGGPADKMCLLLEGRVSIAVGGKQVGARATRPCMRLPCSMHAAAARRRRRGAG